MHTSFQKMALAFIQAWALSYSWFSLIFAYHIKSGGRCSQSCLPITSLSSPLLLPGPPSLFNPHGLSYSLPAALPSTQVSCLSQLPPPSIWTLVICKNGNLSGSSLPTDNRMQANILHLTFMLAHVPFSRLISSNSPQAHSAPATKRPLSKETIFFHVSRCLHMLFPLQGMSFLPALMFSDSRL